MLSRLAPTITVFVNGLINNHWRPIASQRTSGGGRLDYAILQQNLAATEQRVVTLHLNEGVDTEVEIVGFAPFFGQFVYAWGKLSRQKCTVDNGNESIEYVVRVEPYHFGQPVQGCWIYNPMPARYQITDMPLIFNPIIDGKTEGNMRDDDDHPNLLTKVFLHPESARTDEAEEEQEAETKLWTLSQAVRYLCRTCNVDQTYITNPSDAELTAAFSDERDIIRNIHIPDGTYLPDALDRVLKPYGYLWYIDYWGLGPAGRTIRFFKRGSTANQVHALMQPPGQYLDRSLTDTAGFSVEFDVSEMANQVLGLGGFVEIEETFELYRAWPEADDAKTDTPDELLRTHEDFSQVKDVWRKWVLNEAGDYNGLRDDITESWDFSDLADEITGEDFAPPRRRRFLPMLTLNADKSPIGKIDGVSVQYWEPNSETWIDVIDECQILTRECGVYFTGKHPPEEIMRAGEDAKVRVTATIRFDTRIKYLAQQLPSSPNADPITLVLDLSDRFQYRKVVQEEITGDETLAVNDVEKLVYYCEQIRDAWDVAAISGPIHLEGIDNTIYKIGQAVTGVVGRDIDFNAKGPNAPTPAYPQIVGITYDYQRQRTTLMLDQFRADKVIERRSIEDAAENKARKFNKRTGEGR